MFSIAFSSTFWVIVLRCCVCGSLAVVHQVESATHNLALNLSDSGLTYTGAHLAFSGSFR